MNETNKSTITQDLQTLIEKSQSGESLSTEFLQRLSSLDVYDLIHSMI